MIYILAFSTRIINNGTE